MRVLFSLAAAAALLAAPLYASAKPPVKSVTYHTAYHLIHPSTSAGEYTGRLILRFYAGGIVSGSYRNEFQSAIHQVAGGLKGTKIWLTFGNAGIGQFRGVIAKDGKITGTLTNWAGPSTYRFTAVPAS